MLHRFNSDFITVEVPAIVSQAINLDNENVRNNEDLLVPVKSTSIGYQCNEESFTEDLDTSQLSGSKFNVDDESSCSQKQSKINKKSYRDLLRKDSDFKKTQLDSTVSAYLYGDKAAHNRPISSTAQPSTSHGPIHHKSNLSESSHSSQLPTYSVTIDDVRWKLEKTMKKIPSTSNYQAPALARPSREVSTHTYGLVRKTPDTDNEGLTETIGKVEVNKNPEPELNILDSNSTIKLKRMIRKKHLYNLKVILNSTNATLIGHLKDMLYTCFFCDKLCRFPAKLKEHNLAMHTDIDESHFSDINISVTRLDVTGLECNICNRKIDSSEPLYQHLNIYHAKNLFTDINRQMMPVQFKENRPQCPCCLKTYVSCQRLIIHVQRHLQSRRCHLIGNLTCRFCPKQFVSKNHRVAHEKFAHKDGKSCVCNFCGERFNDASEKKVHVDLVHNDHFMYKGHTRYDGDLIKGAPIVEAKKIVHNSLGERNNYKVDIEVPSMLSLSPLIDKNETCVNTQTDKIRILNKNIDKLTTHYHSELSETVKVSNYIVLDNGCVEPTNKCIEYKNNSMDFTDCNVNTKTKTVHSANKYVGTTNEYMNSKVNCSKLIKPYVKQENSTEVTKHNEFLTYDMVKSEDASVVSMEQCITSVNPSAETEDSNETENHGPIIKSEVLCTEEYSIEKNINIPENKENNLDKLVTMTKEKDLHAVKNSGKPKDTSKLKTKDKHIYNIHTILTCTNATLTLAWGTTLADDVKSIGCACYFCNKYHENPSVLKEHTLNTHPTLKDKQFMTINVAEYVAQLDITGVYCKLCNDTLESLEAIYSHLNEFHEKNIFTDILNQILPFKFENDLLMCCVCPMGFKNFPVLWTHLQQCHYRNYECGSCNTYFVNLMKLRSHERVDHKMSNSSISCKYCRKSFKSRTYLTRHLKEAHEKFKTYKNDICNEIAVDITLNKMRIEKSNNTNQNFIEIKPSDINVDPINMKMEISQKCHTCENVSWDALAVHVKQCSSTENINLGKHESVCKTEEKLDTKILIECKQEEDRFDNDAEMNGREIQNEDIDAQAIKMENFEKCQFCNTLFMTWDALSVHIKECSHFAKSFLAAERAAPSSQNTITPRRLSSGH